MRRQRLRQRIRPIALRAPDGYAEVAAFLGTIRSSLPGVTITVSAGGPVGSYSTSSASRPGRPGPVYSWRTNWPDECGHSTELRCYPDGVVAVTVSGSHRTKLRPWNNLNETELRVIESIEWAPSQSKHPLEYLADVDQ